MVTIQIKLMDHQIINKESQMTVKEIKDHNIMKILMNMKNKNILLEIKPHKMIFPHQIHKETKDHNFKTIIIL